MQLITSAILIWLEIKSRLGDRKPKAKRTLLCRTAQPECRNGSTAAWSIDVSLSDEVPQLGRYQGGCLPPAWTIPALESEGMTASFTSAASKFLSGSEEDSLLLGPILRKKPLEREEAPLQGSQ